jgi:hypothetical protein
LADSKERVGLSKKSRFGAEEIRPEEDSKKTKKIRRVLLLKQRKKIRPPLRISNRPV